MSESLRDDDGSTIATFPRDLISLWSTFGLDILRYTMMGAREVLASWEGWLMVSQSSTMICMDRDSSKIRSISAWTSARLLDRELDFSRSARLEGLLRTDFLPREMSALTRVMMIRPSNLFLRNSNTAFCIMSVTS